jgi:GH18 family chitinase
MQIAAAAAPTLLFLFSFRPYRRFLRLVDGITIYTYDFRSTFGKVTGTILTKSL